MSLKGDDILKIGEFAEKAGVTVKTLLHYDKIGLLNPPQKTDSGYRVYCDEDFQILQQIVTLKFVGFSLNEIGDILNNTKGDIESIINFQKTALEEKKKHLEAVITVFEKAQNQIKEKGFLEVAKLTDIIKITNMECKVKEQYSTAENFNLRCSLHSYNINKIDWSEWCFNQMHFPKKARILELGCGTGAFWSKNSNFLSDDWKIILTDLSSGMLHNTKENLKETVHNFTYEEIDAQNLPYEDESFDVIIANSMLYFVPDIEKALSEIKRVLVKDGTFYATTSSRQSMWELNELVKNFDAKLGLHDNGMCYRFNLEEGYLLLKKFFDEINTEVFEGKIIVDQVEPIVNYKASTIKGSSVLVGEKKQEFSKYIEDYLKKNGPLSITTKGGIFKARK